MTKPDRQLEPLKLAAWGIPLMLGGYFVSSGNNSTSVSLLGQITFFVGFLVTAGAGVVWLLQAQEPDEPTEEEEYKV